MTLYRRTTTSGSKGMKHLYKGTGSGATLISFLFSCLSKANEKDNLDVDLINNHPLPGGYFIGTNKFSDNFSTRLLTVLTISGIFII